MKAGRNQNLARLAGACFLSAAIAFATFNSGEAEGQSKTPPFGTQEDIEFAEKLWQAMDGYDEWRMRSGVYPGTSPHGAFLRVFYNVVHVDGEPYHIIVKDNYVGDDVTKKQVEASPDEHLGPVTIMLQRNAGYNPDHGDWYWVKYGPDGSIEKNPKGMSLAGRVAEGTDSGCIACHGNAQGDDYIFTNDP